MHIYFEVGNTKPGWLVLLKLSQLMFCVLERLRIPWRPSGLTVELEVLRFLLMEAIRPRRPTLSPEYSLFLTLEIEASRCEFLLAAAASLSIKPNKVYSISLMLVSRRSLSMKLARFELPESLEEFIDELFEGL